MGSQGPGNPLIVILTTDVSIGEDESPMCLTRDYNYTIWNDW